MWISFKVTVLPASDNNRIVDTCIHRLGIFIFVTMNLASILNKFFRCSTTKITDTTALSVAQMIFGINPKRPVLAAYQRHVFKAPTIYCLRIVVSVAKHFLRLSDKVLSCVTINTNTFITAILKLQMIVGCLLYDTMNGADYLHLCLIARYLYQRIVKAIAELSTGFLNKLLFRHCAVAAFCASMPL